MGGQWVHDGSSNIMLLLHAILDAPVYHLALEVLLLIWVFWLIFRKSYNPREKATLSEKEKQELIEEWEPEPLVPKNSPSYDPDHPALHLRIIQSRIGKYMVVNGRKCLNLSSHNYLGLNEEPSVQEAALKCLEKYGVGSCGPRGFYGTADVHLDFEERLAKFMNSEEACLYSYGFSAIASAIPSYSKRGDVIFVDEAVNFAIQKGLDASRSKVKYFRHNDTDHLLELLLEQQKWDEKNPKKAKATRRFLIVEGIYMNTGDLCPLPRLVELKKQFKVRLFVDENISIGTLGETGRGIFEHYGIPNTEADMICGTLEYALSSIGGFCVGSSYVIDNQRLSGLGYCFSASLPPLLAAGAMAAIDYIDSSSGKAAMEKLRHNSLLAHTKWEDVPGMELVGDPLSPVKHLQFQHPSKNRKEDSRILQEIIKKAEEKGVALTEARYVEQEDLCMPPPSIRLVVSSTLDDSDIQRVADVLHESAPASRSYH